MKSVTVPGMSAYGAPARAADLDGETIRPAAMDVETGVVLAPPSEQVIGEGYAGQVRPSARVVAAESGGRTILVHVSEQRLYTLNDAAGYLWRSLAGGIAVPELVSRFAGRFGVAGAEAREEVIGFLNRVWGAGMITCQGG
jgi:hypothetical protein